MADLTPQATGDEASCDAGQLRLVSDQSFDPSHRFDGRIMSNPLFQHTSPARFTTHLSLIAELRKTAFVTAYSIQFYMP
jgi:hypothetical protein